MTVSTPGAPAPMGMNDAGLVASVTRKTRLFAEMVKWEHSVFALPFAYVGALLAVPDGWPTLAQVGWITMAMVGSRTLAFAVNRAVDKEIDARNPRTADRALPKGLLSTAETVVFGCASLALFVVAVANLAPITWVLAPIVPVMFVVYPYTKRFTWLCHVWLGACLGLAPVGAWIAVTDRMDWQPWLLFAAVTAWTAGFDIIYATQDLEVDRREGLFSIPARFGVGRALTVTRLLHLGSFLLLVATGLLLELGLVYFVGVGVAGALLAYESSLVSADDLSKVDAAFFTMNGVMSVAVFLFVLADKVVRL